MQCMQCRKRIGVGAAYCAYCGTVLRPGGQRWQVVGVAALLSVVLLGGGGYWLQSNASGGAAGSLPTVANPVAQPSAPTALGATTVAQAPAPTAPSVPTVRSTPTATVSPQPTAIPTPEPPTPEPPTPVPPSPTPIPPPTPNAAATARAREQATAKAHAARATEVAQAAIDAARATEVAQATIRAVPKSDIFNFRVVDDSPLVLIFEVDYIFSGTANHLVMGSSCPSWDVRPELMCGIKSVDINPGRGTARVEIVYDGYLADGDSFVSNSIHVSMQDWDNSGQGESVLLKDFKYTKTWIGR